MNIQKFQKFRFKDDSSLKIFMENVLDFYKDEFAFIQVSTF